MPLSPKGIIDKMMAADKMSQWLGIVVTDYSPGAVQLKMTVREEMVNGFLVAHGGITYAIADSALAFSSNSHGFHAMSIETSISHLKKVTVGDELKVSSKELSLTRKTGAYAIEIHNQDNELVAHFKGTVYRSSREWE